MAEDGRRQPLDVVGGNELMAANRRDRLRGPVKRQRGPRAAAEQDVVMLAGVADQIDDVAAQLVIHADGPHHLLAPDDLVGGDHGLDVVDRMLELLPREHRRFFLGRRIPQVEADQEPIELGFGQRKGSLMVDGVLSRDDQERRFQIECRAVDGDLALAHRFQQRGLGARRGPVDLVGQDDLGEDRAGPELELGRLLVEDRGAGDVGRQQVGRALHPLERRPDAAGQRQHRLGHARHILEQDVPLGKIGDQRQDDLLALADHDLLDIGDDLLAGCRHVRHALPFDRALARSVDNPPRRSSTHRPARPIPQVTGFPTECNRPRRTNVGIARFPGSRRTLDPGRPHVVIRPRSGRSDPG